MECILPVCSVVLNDMYKGTGCFLPLNNKGDKVCSCHLLCGSTLTFSGSTGSRSFFADGLGSIHRPHCNSLSNLFFFFFLFPFLSPSFCIFSYFHNFSLPSFSSPYISPRPYKYFSTKIPLSSRQRCWPQWSLRGGRGISQDTYCQKTAVKHTDPQ